MTQLPLPHMGNDSIINIASVKHRSPFRYPGGKTWLVPKIYTWLPSLPQPPQEFFEPFAGGAIVSLSVAFTDLAAHITMSEIDEQVASVWQSIFVEDNGLWLADRIATFEFNELKVVEVLESAADSTREKAFQTIIKNRVNRGGILAAGAGKIKAGENGKGLTSRWYPETIKKRIEDLITIRHRVSFLAEDGLQIIEANAHRPDVVFFVDPPYSISVKGPGRRLYDHSELDHDRLFRLLSEGQADFLMTYDNEPEVSALAARYGLQTHPVAMKTTHHATLSELMIGRNLNWLRPSP